MVKCDECGSEATDKGSLISWPDGSKQILCGNCYTPGKYPERPFTLEFFWGFSSEIQDKRSDRWFAVMHVMSRLGVFKPYIKWVEQILDYVSGIEEK